MDDLVQSIGELARGVQKLAREAAQQYSAGVDFPIAEVSKHSAREKSIRHGHPSTFHLWRAQRERRRHELERQRSLSLQAVERIANVMILPQPEREAPDVRRMRPSLETEDTTMRVVMEHEEAQGRQFYLAYPQERILSTPPIESDDWVHENESPLVGLILCARKNKAVAHYALEGLPNKVMTAEYRTALPDEKTLAAEIRRTQEILQERKKIAPTLPGENGTKRTVRKRQRIKQTGGDHG